MKRLIASFFAMLFIVAVFAVPAFAADAREPSPGLISERIVTDDEGNTGIIRVYKLDENGEFSRVSNESRTSFVQFFNMGFSL